MISSRTFKDTRHLEKHYDLQFLRDYYGTDVQAMQEILRLYFQETPKQMSQIEDALLSGETGRAKELTHKIKMNIAMLGIVDPGGFITAMHRLNSSAVISGEAVALFQSLKTEVHKALADIQKDFFNWDQ